MNQQVDRFLAAFFWCVIDRILYGRKNHRTQPGACLYDSSHSLFLTQQPLKSNPTVTSGLPNIIQWSAWCDENNISCSCSLSADLICEGAPISVHSVCLASGSSLSTWHYLNLAVSSPCLHPSVPQTRRLGSDFQITLGERLQSRRNKSTVSLQDAVASILEKVFKCLFLITIFVLWKYLLLHTKQCVSIYF